MIRSFQHKGLQAFFETGSKASIQPHHSQKLLRLLARLDVAKGQEDVSLPGWRLHSLVGNLVGFHSVSVNGNWRMTFTFEDGDAVLVDDLDYHSEKTHERDARVPPPWRGVA